MGGMMKFISHELLEYGSEFHASLTLGDRKTYRIDAGAGAELCLLFTLEDREELEKAGLLNVTYIDRLERLEGHHAKANGFTHLKVEIRPKVQKLEGQTVYGIRLSELVRSVGRRQRWTTQPTDGVWK